MPGKKRGAVWIRVAVALILVPVLLIGIRTGGLHSPVQTPNGMPAARAAEMPNVSCQKITIPVKLSAGGLRSYDIVGDLCSRGGPDHKVLQILISGAGYGPLYWDFPYRPDIYSYTRQALRAGFATFNFHRLGVGESDHPFGLLLDVDRQAFVLEMIRQALESQTSFAGLVTVGHSFGSTIALAHALEHPEHVDGLVLTGFLHNKNPQFAEVIRNSVGLAAFNPPFAWRLFDPTYIISTAGQRSAFYNLDVAEPVVIEIDELNRQTTTMGEVISTTRYFDEQSKALKVPVMMVVGEDDFVVCGGDLDCRDEEAVRRHEQDFYPEDVCLEVVVVENSNHNLNLHPTATETFAHMLRWTQRRVGTSRDDLPAEPCVAQKS